MYSDSVMAINGNTLVCIRKYPPLVLKEGPEVPTWSGGHISCFSKQKGLTFHWPIFSTKHGDFSKCTLRYYTFVEIVFYAVYHRSEFKIKRFIVKNTSLAKCFTSIKRPLPPPPSWTPHSGKE